MAAKRLYIKELAEDARIRDLLRKGGVSAEELAKAMQFLGQVVPKSVTSESHDPAESA